MGFYRPPIFYALALARRRLVYRCSSRHPRLGDFLSMMEEARGITANRIRFDHSTVRSRFRPDRSRPASNPIGYAEFRTRHLPETIPRTGMRGKTHEPK